MVEKEDKEEVNESVGNSIMVRSVYFVRYADTRTEKRQREFDHQSVQLCYARMYIIHI